VRALKCHPSLQKNTARSAPALGLRNRAQRLSEYGARRAAILGRSGTAGCGSPSQQLPPGRKRRRWYDVPPPSRLANAVELAPILEEGEEAEESLSRRGDEGLEANEMELRTVMFGLGSGKGWLSGFVPIVSLPFASSSFPLRFKYDPQTLKAVLFPGRGTSNSAAPPPRKRRKLDSPPERPDLEDRLPKSVILECDKDARFILSPVEGKKTAAASGHGQLYSISLVLDADGSTVMATRDEDVNASASSAPPARLPFVSHNKPIDPILSIGPSNPGVADITDAIPGPTLASLPELTPLPAPSSTDAPMELDTALDNLQSFTADQTRASEMTAIPSANEHTAKTVLSDFAACTDQGLHVRELYQDLGEKDFAFGKDGVRTIDQAWSVQVKRWKWHRDTNAKR
jgi:hypothetical protein